MKYSPTLASKSLHETIQPTRHKEGTPKGFLDAHEFSLLGKRL